MEVFEITKIYHDNSYYQFLLDDTFNYQWGELLLFDINECYKN